ncbi:hypothetical protein AAY77_09230, partial [Providencia rettgeri]
TARLNDVTDGTHGVTEILCIILLVTTTEDRHNFTAEINFFQCREKIIPVTLCFAVIPSRDTQQQEIKPFDVLFAALGNIPDFCDIIAE